MKRASDIFERPNSKRRMIGELCEEGLTKKQVYEKLIPLVHMQTKPMIFSNNVGGRRVAIQPVRDQLPKLRDEIGRVFVLMDRSVNADFDSDEIPIDNPPEPDPVSDKPKAKGKQTVKDELQYFLRRVREVRQFCIARAELSEPLDTISMRPALAASKLIPAGIPADALLASMTLHWPIDARRDAGIPTVDFKALSRQICDEKEIDMNGKHELFGYVLTLAEERIPIMLVGPMGTGKSYLAKQISDYLELPYGETAMSAGATRGDLLGRLTANPDLPFILSKCAEQYSGGGVFNFEEIDAALPEVLITLNNALAGEKMFNSANGEEYDRHPDFIPISTANTWGLGANREYVAREKLDAATIDRWRMGRVYIELDESVEEKILFSGI